MKKLVFSLLVITIILSTNFKVYATYDYYSPEGNPIPSFGSVLNPVPGSSLNAKYEEEKIDRCKGIRLGVDSENIGGPGKKVVSVKEGTVVFVGYKEPELVGYRIKNGVSSPWYDGYEASGRGNYVIINHGVYERKLDENGEIIEPGWEVTTGYYHLWDVNVSIGDFVSSGTVIGTVGSTGDSVENGLCFEIMAGGRKVNPELFISYGSVVQNSKDPYLDEDINKFAGKDIWEDGEDTTSILGDFLNKTFDISLNDGSDIYRPNQKNKRIDYNNEIRIDNSSAPQVSLYDRFGGSIQFIPYYGEKKISLSLVDTIYEKIKYMDDLPHFEIGDIFNKRVGILNNEVYTGRPEVISEDDRKAGARDPRVEHYSGLSITGGNAAVGNMYLSAGNFITRTILWFSGNGIFNLLGDIWDTAVTSGVWTAFADQIIRFIPIILIFFVVYMLKVISKFIKNDVSIKSIIINVGNYIITITILFYLIFNPDSFTNITKSFVSVIDTMFATALNATGDEVSQSSDLDLVTEASIWKQAVLDPWCKGMFDGKEYSELYTQFETNPDLVKLDQSNDDIFTNWDTGEYRYNSKHHTGDIKIPIGNGKYVRNWAALAWSTQSNYHINAVDESSEISVGVWPYAETTPKNQSIYIDNFRWIDAKLNISPQYTSPESWNTDYADSKSYQESFSLRGFESLCLGLLLIPLMWPISKRIISIIQVVILSGHWLVRSIRSMISPDDNSYSILNNLKKIFKPLYHYFWWSLIMFVIMSLYLTMTDTFIGSVIYLIFSIVIIKIAKPVDSYRQLRAIRRTIHRKYNESKRYISNKIEREKAKK